MSIPQRLGHTKELKEKRWELKCNRKEQDHFSIPGNKEVRDTPKHQNDKLFLYFNIF